MLGRGRGRLNTLLELKVENERLQQHIRVLRAHSQQVSAGQVTQHLGPYAADDMSAQLAANLGLPARSTLGGDPSRPHYSSISHGYEAGNFPAVLEDDGDSEPRRKKAILLRTDLHVVLIRSLFSSENHLVASSIYAIHVAAPTLRNGERYSCQFCLCVYLLISLDRRVPVVRKLSAMPAVFDGQRRCANSRRQPRRAISVSFLSTTQYPLSLVALTTLLSLWGIF
jgi:hypothetical protein